jgi:hypothetical protein
LLGVVLWAIAAAFLLALLARMPFQNWIALDVLAVLVCGLIGFTKRVRLLQIVAGMIGAAFVLRFTLPLWIMIDLFVMGACGYTGYLFCVGKIDHQLRG